MTEHPISLDTLSRIRDGSGHSVFSASSSHMWLECAGSLIPNLLEEDEGNVDAAYGTVAHGLAEEWLKTHVEPHNEIGKLVFVPGGEFGYGIDIDEEMMEYVRLSVDRCIWLPGEHLVEIKVPYSHVTPIPNQGGTLDHAAMEMHRVTMTDHKFGSSPHNIVYAEENPQLMMYCLGLNQLYGAKYRFKDFILRVNQPRLDHYDEWHCTKARLIEFAAYVKERAALAWVHDAPRTPGAKQCQYCKVQATCTANAMMQVEMLNAVFSDETKTVEEMERFKRNLDNEIVDLVPSDATRLSTKQMSTLLGMRRMAEKWWTTLYDELDKRAGRGEQIPGWKLVYGQTHRQFTDRNAAAKLLMDLGIKRDDIYKEKMVSPAQAEDILRAKLHYRPKQLEETLAPLVFKPDGKPSLVPDHDRRSEIIDSTSGVFSDETRETVDNEDF